MVQALELVLGQADTPASQARSAFTLALAIYSMTATATVLSETPVDGDSLQDQIDALTAEPSKRNRHLGAIIGSSVGSGVALLLLTAAFVIFGRGWLNKRRLQKQTAAWRKVTCRPSTALHCTCCFSFVEMLGLLFCCRQPLQPR